MRPLCKQTDILPVREQCRLCDEILAERLQTLMPQLLRECGVDLWLVLCREYNEDPVFRTLTPQLVRNASRTACFAFCLDTDGGFEALNLSRPDPRLAPYYRQAYDPRSQDQFEAIAQLVAARQPARVAVNVSADCAMADGLSKTLFDRLQACLGDRLIPDDRLAVRWLETRTPRELALYPEIYRLAAALLEEAYSPAVITPGVTTTTDVEWFLLQRLSDLGLEAWFSPDVDLQRQGVPEPRLSGAVIRKGDLLHTDFGLVCCNLHTDTQRLAYVLKDGETAPPPGLLAGLARANRFQDLVCGNFAEGRTGNEILRAALAQAGAEGLSPRLYTHPIGLYGHGAGPAIGLFDRQDFVPGAGERRLHDRTCYALELNVTEPVPEWDGQEVCFMLEETIAFRDGRTHYLGEGRDRLPVIG